MPTKEEGSSSNPFEWELNKRGKEIQNGDENLVKLFKDFFETSHENAIYTGTLEVEMYLIENMTELCGYKINFIIFLKIWKVLEHIVYAINLKFLVSELELFLIMNLQMRN